MRILITGATGFVGKNLVPYLYQKGINEIALLIRDDQKSKLLFPELNPLIILCGELSWREKVIGFNPDVVIHLAALFTTKDDPENALRLVESNILFSTLLLEAVSHTVCGCFINIGTFTEFLYGGGEYFANNLYSATKTAIRPIIQYYQTQAKWKWINVVVYSPYGRHSVNKKVIDHLVSALDSSIPIKFSKGEQILDFIHVDDMSCFFYTLISKLDSITDRYTQFHLGTGVGHSIRDVASILEQVSGKKINADWGGYPYRSFDAMYAVAPIAKNIDLLGWRSKIDINEGLEILISEPI